MSGEVLEMYRNAVKLRRKVEDEANVDEDPPEPSGADPHELSFWFASLFAESQLEQQKVILP